MNSVVSRTPVSYPTSPWPTGGGKMGQRIRDYDWTQHPLGPPENWPQSLRTTISIMLSSRYAMWMGWGAEFWFFCNDAYLPTLGIKESWALGASARKVWEEIWTDIGPRAESVVETGNATWDEGLLLFLERSGFTEETYHTFSYSPIPDDCDGIGGMLCVVTEETERVLGERRLALLGNLAAALTSVKTEEELFDAVKTSLDKHSTDLPLGLLYFFEGKAHQARLCSCSGVPAGSGCAPKVIDLYDASAAWPTEKIIDANIHLGLEPMPDAGEDVPVSIRNTRTRHAFTVRIFQNGVDEPAGFFVAGINPYRPFDFAYQGFIDLLAGQIAAALSNVRAYEQERQRAEALAELDRAKTEFFNNVSHEFRTPLTLMLGPIEDILNQPAGEAGDKYHQMAEVAHRNGLRLLKLVNTLLDFSRIEAGRLEAACEPVDLAMLTADLASSFRSAIEKAGLKFDVDCKALSEPVYVDRNLWEKIVLNLLSNAFKFTLEGSISVTVREFDGHVDLIVRDTGVGIPKEAQERLFERFYRVSGIQSRSHEGSGIGLALVNELAILHGGQIAVESEPGKGSVFTVSIRKGKEHLSQDKIRPAWKLSDKILDTSFKAEMQVWGDESISSPTVKMSDEIDGRNRNEREVERSRVLIVDDNADMRNYLANLLSGEFEVLLAPNGQVAMEMIQHSPPDLVLSDVMMPVMDGFGLLAAIRSRLDLCTLPVILLSARAGNEASVDGLDAGADDYLVKPFSALELVTRVKTHLGLAKMRQNANLEIGRAEGRMQNLLAMLPAAVYACDAEGRITFFNEQAVKLWHFRPEIGTNSFDICAYQNVFHPDGTRVTNKQTPLEATIKDGTSFRNLEAELQRHDGSTFMGCVSIDPILDEHGKVVGAINVFQDISELKIAEQTLADQLRERKIAERHANFLARLSQEMLLLTKPEDILKKAASEVGKHLDVDWASFCELEDNQMIVRHGWAKGGKPLLDGNYPPDDFGERQMWVILEKHGISVDDVATNAFTSNFIDNYRKLGMAAFVLTSFGREGQGLSMIFAANAEPKAWRQDELELLNNVIARVRPLVSKAQGMQALKRRNERMQLLSETQAQLLSARDPDTVIKELFGRVATHLQADTYFNFMVNEKEKALFLHSYTGISEAVVPTLRRLEYGQAICGTVAETRQSITANDIQHTDYEKANLVRGLGIQTYACNPLMVGGRLLGTLSFASRTRSRFDDDELEFIRIISHSAALVLDQLRTTRELKETAERLGLAMAASRMGDWSWDVATDKAKLSPVAAEIMGVPAGEDLTFSGIVGMLHEDDRDRARDALMHAVKNQSEYVVELRLLVPGADCRWLAVNARPILNDEGNVQGMLGVLQDVTARRRDEETRSHFAAIVTSSDDAILSKDLNGIIRGWNIGAERMFGYTEQEVVGQPITILIPNDLLDEEAEILRRIRANKPIEHLETVRRRKDGSLVDVSLTISPMRDQSGKLVGASKIARDITERKRVENALISSERRWREMAEAMPHLVWTCGPEGAYDFISPQWCAYTGRTEEEQRGFGWAESIHPDDRARLEEEWNKAAHARVPVDLEMRIRRADGEYRWFKSRAVPVMDQAGNILKWYGSNTDIEDLKRTDIALREREARLSAIFAQAGSGIIQTDLNGNILMVNDAYCEIVARPREELMGMRIYDITHPDDRAENLQAFENLMAGGPAFVIEKREVRPDGSFVWVRNSVVGIRDASGMVTAGLTIAQDITDSREAEDALRASEEQLRLVTDHAPVLLAQIDTSHRYKFVNLPYATRYGFSPAEVIGKPVWEIVGRSAYNTSLEMMNQAFTGERVEFEMEIPYDAFGERWAHVIYVPERMAEGGIIGIVAVLTDITMRKQAEKELEQARDRALAAVRAKDDFLARLSHELRTPLSPVLLLASEGAANSKLPQAAREDFEIIRKNVDLEARLIDDLLDLTRITRGKLKLDLRQVDLHAVLRDAIGTIQSEAATKGVQLTLKLDAAKHDVFGDAVRLQQVFWNLLNNAVKFTPKDGIIYINTTSKADTNTILVEVSDTGIGMTEAELSRVFDAFSQGDHANGSGATRFGGLGLGLAITRMLVELHQGGIAAQSAGRGQGASFTIELPLANAESFRRLPKEKSPLSSEAPVLKEQHAQEKVRKGLKILLVEDHEPTRMALTSLLTRRKHEVTTAGSLAEARFCFAPGKFDLIISDIGLPDGYGYELMSEWREVPGLRGIAVSGYGMEHDVSRSWEAGFSSHLTKPVKMETLEVAIAEAMAGITR